jgi:hypothetical protein
MRQKMNPNSLIGLSIAIVLFSSLTIAAQTAGSFIAVKQQNAVMLRNYEWKSRITVQRDGEVKNDQLFLMSYDENGDLLKVTLAKMPEMKLPGGLRGVIAKKKKEEFINTLTEIQELAKAYGDLSAEQMKNFMRTARFTREEKLVRIEGSNLLQSGDLMTMWIDPISQRQRRVEVLTTLDQKQVKIVTEFHTLSDGPTYMARSQTALNSAGILIVTENFDFTAKSSIKTVEEN